MPSAFWRNVSQIFLDSVDVDLRVFQQHVADGMRQHPSGEQFARWVKQNPVQFELLIRGLSVLIKRQNRSLRSRGQLADALADQLASLPHELRRAFTSTSEPLQAPVTDEISSDDPPLAVVLTLLQDAREQGEFAGAFVRELVRQIDPTQLKGLRQHLDARPLGRSALSQGSPLTAVDQVRAIEHFSSEFGITPAPDRATLAHDLDQPLFYELRVSREQAFQRSFNGPATSNPVLSNASSLDGLIRTLIALFKDIRPQDYADFVAAKGKLVRIRFLWVKERRPDQWLRALSLIDSSL